MNLEEFLASLYIRHRDIDHLIHTTGAQNRRVNLLWAIRCANDKDFSLRAVVQLTQELIDLSRCTFVMDSRAVRNHSVQLIEANDRRSLLCSLLEEFRNLALCAVDIDAPQVRRLNHHKVQVRLFGKLLGNECLAASRRAIEERTIRSFQTILCSLLFVLHHEHNILIEHTLYALHTCDIRKTTANTRSYLLCIKIFFNNRFNTAVLTMFGVC